MTVQSHCIERFENLLQRYVGEGWVAMDNINTIFSQDPVTADQAIIVGDPVTYMSMLKVECNIKKLTPSTSGLLLYCHKGKECIIRNYDSFQAFLT